MGSSAENPERYADRLPYRFERVMVGTLSVFRFVGYGLGANIPLRLTLGGLTFAGQYVKNGSTAGYATMLIG